MTEGMVAVEGGLWTHQEGIDHRAGTCGTAFPFLCPYLDHLTLTSPVTSSGQNTQKKTCEWKRREQQATRAAWPLRAGDLARTALTSVHS